MCNSAHCLPYPTLIPPSSRPRVVKTLWPGWRTPSKSPEFWFEALGPRSLACQSTGEIKVRDEALSNREWENIFSPLIPLTHFATVVRSFMLPILYPVPIQTCSNREREGNLFIVPLLMQQPVHWKSPLRYKMFFSNFISEENEASRSLVMASWWNHRAGVSWWQGTCYSLHHPLLLLTSRRKSRRHKKTRVG